MQVLEFVIRESQVPRPPTTPMLQMNKRRNDLSSVLLILMYSTKKNMKESESSTIPVPN